MIDHIVYLVLAHAAGAIRAPEEALLVLNVLPKDRAPSVLAAVLSRDFKEFSPARAIKHGLGLVLLPHYPENILISGLHEILVAAAESGDLPTLQLLWQLAGLMTPRPYAVKQALRLHR
ncbi:hypothetical protein BC828DRAFT_396709 [Blastocladiella britannica]|nr:hypothetical protein BC828DRAFT_396709 [Blastocladiella britannica]